MTDELREYWLNRFISLGICILEEIDLSLPIDANIQLCEALERCNAVELELLNDLEPDKTHDSQLGRDLPNLIRESSVSDLSGMWQELQESISFNISLRRAALKSCREPIEDDLDTTTSRYLSLHENLRRLVNETIKYRSELSKRIDQLSSLAECTICELKPEDAFNFISNVRVRSRILKMHKELSVIEREQLFVAGTVILRSILESVLVWALLKNKAEAAASYRYYKGADVQGSPVPPIAKWGWDELVHVSRRNGILETQETVDACIYFNSCRNRIHPWYDKTIGEEPSSKTYVIGKIAYKSILTEMERWQRRKGIA